MTAPVVKNPSSRQAKPSVRAQQRLSLRLMPTGMDVPRALPKKERFLEVKITDKEVAMLYQLIEYEGLQPLAKVIGVSDVTILRVTAGLFHRCRPPSQHAIKRFFAAAAGE